MNKRLISVLVFALVISAGASYLLYRVISAQIAASGKNSTGQLVVATHNLEIGSLIKDTDVKLGDWGGAPLQGAFTKIEDVVGRGVIQPVVEGEAVLESRIAVRGGGAGLAAIIPPGMRAVAVRVNEVLGVSGFVTTGQRVDILVAGNAPGGGAQTTGTLTRTLLQNIEVLSAGQNIQKDPEGKPVSVAVVNLLVTPDQAEVLSLASNEARIQLVLRNPLDKAVAQTPGTSVAFLFSGVNPAAPAAPKAAPVKRAPVLAPPPPPRAPEPVKATPPPPPPPILVEVIHGSRRTESKFQNEEKDAASEAKK